MMTLRAAFALLVVLAAMLTLPGSAEARQRRAVQPAIVVDVSALRARGLTVEADIVQSTIASEIARNGPHRGRVYVRITGLSLSSFVGSSNQGFRSFGSGGSGSDFIEGDFQVLGPNGEVLAGQPLLVNAPSSSGGAWYLEGVDQRRIAAVARSFAGWVRQYGG